MWQLKPLTLNFQQTSLYHLHIMYLTQFIIVIDCNPLYNYEKYRSVICFEKL